MGTPLTRRQQKRARRRQAMAQRQANAQQQATQYYNSLGTKLLTAVQVPLPVDQANNASKAEQH